MFIWPNQSSSEKWNFELLGIQDPNVEHIEINYETFQSLDDTSLAEFRQKFTKPQIAGTKKAYVLDVLLTNDELTKGLSTDQFQSLFEEPLGSSKLSGVQLFWDLPTKSFDPKG